MSYIVKIDDKEFKVELQKEGNNFKVYLNGKERNVEVANEKGARLILIVDNKPFNVILESANHILVNGEIYSTEIFDEQIQKLIKASPEKLHKKELTIKAPMPGLIIDIEVKEGDSVKAGQGLLIVEAMKMQNEMKTSRDGIVKKVFVQKGQTVNRGDTLIIIE